MECRAFTSSFDGISNKLTNSVTVETQNYTSSTTALWDTGATSTCISHEVAQSLHAIPVGKCNIHTPTGADTKDTYLVDIILPNNVKLENHLVIDSEIGGQGIGLLVGMDIISQGDFAVTNVHGKTTFTFRHPAIEQIDFVKKLSVQEKIGKPHGKGNSKKRHK